MAGRFGPKLLDVLKDAGYLPFCFDTATGLPMLLQDDAAISDNLIAVPRGPAFRTLIPREYIDCRGG